MTRYHHQMTLSQLAFDDAIAYGFVDEPIMLSHSMYKYLCDSVKEV